MDGCAYNLPKKDAPKRSLATDVYLEDVYVGLRKKERGGGVILLLLLSRIQLVKVAVLLFFSDIQIFSNLNEFVN